MRNINKIVIHCSDSNWGSAEAIDQWHKERGWDGIGYHYVITNGFKTFTSKYTQEDDGVIQDGRPVEKQGAHVKGYNKDSVGVCLIGKEHFSSAQLYTSLPNLLAILMVKYNVKVDQIMGHYELDIGKTCPNLNMEGVRLQMGDIDL